MHPPSVIPPYLKPCQVRSSLPLPPAVLSYKPVRSAVCQLSSVRYAALLESPHHTTPRSPLTFIYYSSGPGLCLGSGDTTLHTYLPSSLSVVCCGHRSRWVVSPGALDGMALGLSGSQIVYGASSSLTQTICVAFEGRSRNLEFLLWVRPWSS